MAIELPVSSNIISGLDVLLVDILLVTVCHLLTHGLFSRLKTRKLFVHVLPDQLISTSAGNLSVELLGHRSMAVLLVANSVCVVVLALLTGFGITGRSGVKLEQPIQYLHAHLSQRPLNVSDLDAFIVGGHEPNRKTVWGGVFHQQNECHQMNMTHVTLIRMATNITSADSSEEDGIWPPRSTNRICLDPMVYVDAEKGKREVSDSVLHTRRRNQIGSIGECHLFYEGTGEIIETEYSKGKVITETFTQPTVLRNCIPGDVMLESLCAKGMITACVTRFTTPEKLDLIVVATWNINQVVTESAPEWRNMVLTDVTRSDLRPALSLSNWQQWNVAQMIAGRYVGTLNEAVIASNSALTITRVQRRGQSVSVTSLSLRLFFVPLGIIVMDIFILLLALAAVTIQLRLHGVLGRVNVAADTKELLSLLTEMLSPKGADKVKLLLRPRTEAEAEQEGSEGESAFSFKSKVKATLDILHTV